MKKIIFLNGFLLCALSAQSAHAGTWTPITGLPYPASPAIATASYGEDNTRLAGAVHDVGPVGNNQTQSYTLKWRWTPAYAGEPQPTAPDVGVMQTVQVSYGTATAQATQGAFCTTSISASPHSTPNATAYADVTRNSASAFIPSTPYSQRIDYRTSGFQLAQEYGYLVLICPVRASVSASVSGRTSTKGLLRGYAGPLDASGYATTGIRVTTTAVSVVSITRAE